MKFLTIFVVLAMSLAVTNAQFTGIGNIINDLANGFSSIFDNIMGSLGFGYGGIPLPGPVVPPPPPPTGAPTIVPPPASSPLPSSESTTVPPPPPTAAPTTQSPAESTEGPSESSSEAL